MNTPTKICPWRMCIIPSRLADASVNRWRFYKSVLAHPKVPTGGYVLDLQGGEPAYEKLAKQGLDLLERWAQQLTGVPRRAFHDRDAAGHLWRSAQELCPQLPTYEENAEMAKAKKTAAPAPAVEDEDLDDTVMEDGDEEQEAPVKKGAKGKAAAAPAKKGAVGKGVGVIAVIQQMLERKSGATVEEIVANLTEKYPDRNPDGMRSTVRIQVNRLPKKLGREVTKTQSEKRGGTVYQMAAG